MPEMHSEVIDNKNKIGIEPEKKLYDNDISLRVTNLENKQE